MRIKKFNQSVSPILMMLVQFVVLLGCFIYLDYLYLTNIHPDQIAAVKFVETKCFVMTKKLTSRGKIFRRYRADFLINYPANGAQYNRWVSGNGLDLSYTSNSATQELVLSDFADGKNYKCWYNPENPEEVMLVPRKRWFVRMSFIAPTIIGIVALILFLKNFTCTVLRMRKKK